MSCQACQVTATSAPPYGELVLTASIRSTTVIKREGVLSARCEFVTAHSHEIGTIVKAPLLARSRPPHVPSVHWLADQRRAKGNQRNIHQRRTVRAHCPAPRCPEVIRAGAADCRAQYIGTESDRKDTHPPHPAIFSPAPVSHPYKHINTIQQLTLLSLAHTPSRLTSQYHTLPVLYHHCTVGFFFQSSIFAASWL
jgi:hypothetical protein